MQMIKKDQCSQHQNSPSCVVTELPLEMDAVNFAVAHIRGRYPEANQACNRISKEMVYIQSGQGHITIDGQAYALNAGDVILIEPNEPFFWEGDMTLFITCQPAWTKEQHTYIE
jgi:mannose-6-phosphate isomerase-like protein (cupin superfamily)